MSVTSNKRLIAKMSNMTKEYDYIYGLNTANIKKSTLLRLRGKFEGVHMMSIKSKPMSKYLAEYGVSVAGHVTYLFTNTPLLNVLHAVNEITCIQIPKKGADVTGLQILIPAQNTLNRATAEFQRLKKNYPLKMKKGMISVSEEIRQIGQGKISSDILALAELVNPYILQRKIRMLFAIKRSDKSVIRSESIDFVANFEKHFKSCIQNLNEAYTRKYCFSGVNAGKLFAAAVRVTSFEQ